MKTLLLMRHGKSSWDNKDMDDRQRPLSKRGRKNAARMGALLLEQNLIPDLILASNAVRSRQTAELVIDALDFQGDHCFLNKLYMAEVEEYVKEIQRVTDDLNTVLLIGHNPSLEGLLQMLTSEIEPLPTGAIAHITLSVEHWKDFQTETLAELVNIWRPKQI